MLLEKILLAYERGRGLDLGVVLKILLLSQINAASPEQYLELLSELRRAAFVALKTASELATETRLALFHLAEPEPNRIALPANPNHFQDSAIPELLDDHLVTEAPGQLHGVRLDALDVVRGCGLQLQDQLRRVKEAAGLAAAMLCT